MKSVISWIDASLEKPAAARWLADQRDHLGPVDRAERVDHALCIGLGCAQLREVAPLEVRDHEPPALEYLRPLGRLPDQLELDEVDRLVERLEDEVHVGAGLDELGGEPEGLRRGVRVLEATGV